MSHIKYSGGPGERAACVISHQIRMQADRLLGPELSDVDGNTEQRVGTISVFNGPTPIIRVLESTEDESHMVGTWLWGDIRWADLNPTRGREQAGRRPVLILSNDVFNERSGTVIAVVLTSQPQRAGFPLTLELSAPGLPTRSWVKISHIRTLAVERIGQQLARVTPEEMLRVIEGLNEIIGT